ncbi:MAG: VCBS repeat-containing protein [Kouleothrix sp.]|nr:VCBS repeat-containing protein [Kouleothrix sp.]
MPTRIRRPPWILVLFVLVGLNLTLSPAPHVFAATNFTDIGAGLAGDITWGSTMSWADYDNDGDLDLLVSGYYYNGTLGGQRTTLYRNTNGVFADAGANLPGVFAGAHAWADYDNDGDLDLALAGYWTLVNGPILKIYRNTNGTFADSNTLFPGFPSGAYGLQNAALAWGDYDNDGDPDLAVSGVVNNTDQIISRIYRNDAGSFVDIQAGLLATTQGSLDWGDYDNDGDLDLLLTGVDKIVNGAPHTRIYQNNAGTFTALQSGLPDIAFGKAAWGDFDNDGDLDVALVGAIATNLYLRAVYTNNGGTFVSQFSAQGGSASRVLGWGDYDNDGYSDLFILGNLGVVGNVQIFHNNGGTSWSGINNVFPDSYQNAAAWADYDNDGDLDLALMACTDPTDATTCTSTGFTRIYRNNGNPANTPPAAPAALQAALAGQQATLSWNAPADAQTASPGLSYNLRVGTSPGGSNIVAPMANPSTGYRRLPKRGSIGSKRSWTTTLPYGTYYWSVQAIDPAFAGSAWAMEGSFTIIQPDTTAPTGSISINSNAAIIGSTQVTLFLSASDTGGSGLKEMRFSNDGVSWGGWEQYTTMRLFWNLVLGDGVKTVYAQFRDGAGNISATATDTIILDTTPPSVVTFALNGGAQFTNSPNLGTSITGSDTNDLSVVRLSNKPDKTFGKLTYGADYTYAKGSVLGVPWSLTESATGGSANNGPRTVYIQFRDVANNWSLVGNATIFLDTVAPTGTLAINTGAAQTTNTDVMLTLVGDDAAPASGVAVMRFSNDGTNWSSWEPYAATRGWTLSGGAGIKTVRVQYRDNAGNLSAVEQATIVLEPNQLEYRALVPLIIK